MSTAAKAPKRTPYRVSPPVDEWVKGEAERLGISRNAVVEMRLRECMTRSTMTLREKRALRDASGDDNAHD